MLKYCCLFALHMRTHMRTSFTSQQTRRPQQSCIICCQRETLQMSPLFVRKLEMERGEGRGGQSGQKIFQVRLFCHWHKTPSSFLRYMFCPCQNQYCIRKKTCQISRDLFRVAQNVQVRPDKLCVICLHAHLCVNTPVSVANAILNANRRLSHFRGSILSGFVALYFVWGRVTNLL